MIRILIGLISDNSILCESLTSTCPATGPCRVGCAGSDRGAVCYLSARQGSGGGSWTRRGLDGANYRPRVRGGCPRHPAVPETARGRGPAQRAQRQPCKARKAAARGARLRGAVAATKLVRLAGLRGNASHWLKLSSPLPRRFLEIRVAWQENGHRWARDVVIMRSDNGIRLSSRPRVADSRPAGRSDGERS